MNNTTKPVGYYTLDLVRRSFNWHQFVRFLCPQLKTSHPFDVDELHAAKFCAHLLEPRQQSIAFHQIPALSYST